MSNSDSACIGDSCLTFSARCNCGMRSSLSRLTSGFFSGARMRQVTLEVYTKMQKKCHYFDNDNNNDNDFEIEKEQAKL